MPVAEADAMLTGPGGFFEIVTETVNGIEMGVVAGPHPSLRDLLAASMNHGERGARHHPPAMPARRVRPGAGQAPGRGR